jgi:hypothetical protein
MDEEKNEKEQEDWLSDTKEWLADNVRIVISVVIVLGIAVGVWFYSKREAGEFEVAMTDEENQEETMENEETVIEEGEEGMMEEEAVEEQVDNEEESVEVEVETEGEEAQVEIATEEQEVEVSAETEGEEAVEVEVEAEDGEVEEVIVEEEPIEEEPVVEEEVIEEEPVVEEEVVEKEQEEPIVEESQPVEEPVVEEQLEPVVASQGDNYEVTAGAGDSLTTLARSVLGQYLQKNNVADLRAEHKVYIEDYLARRMGYTHRIEVGETKSVASSQIEEAINQAKDLPESSLQKIAPYANQVPNI